MSEAEAPTIYADSSALLRLLLEQPESAALHSFLATSGMRVESCELTITEMLRIATREQLDHQRVELVLGRLNLLTLDTALLYRAGRLPSPPGTLLRSMDAIHVAAAIELGSAVFLTYDRRQLGAARMVGLHTAAPGLDSPS